MRERRSEDTCAYDCLEQPAAGTKSISGAADAAYRTVAECARGPPGRWRDILTWFAERSRHDISVEEQQNEHRARHPGDRILTVDIISCLCEGIARYQGQPTWAHRPSQQRAEAIESFRQHRPDVTLMDLGCLT